MNRRPPIVVTSQDHDHLIRLLETHASRRDADACAALETELERAQVLAPDEVPGDVVTMYSTVRFREADGAAQEIQLVYPHGADPAQGRVSILAPVASALLGLSAGESIDWPFPDGRTRRLHVDAVCHQPAPEGSHA